LNINKFNIDGPMLIESKVFRDERGFFLERYREDLFKEIGVPANFIQDNFSRSDYKVLRGLHYQFDKPQSKLVTCTRGEVLDVAVDIRKNSKTFGESIIVILDGNNPRWLWIPPGFAHGFCVLSKEGADVMYKVDTTYNKDGESGIMWNDKDLDIKWEISDPLISVRDRSGLSFSQYKLDPRF